MLSTTFRLRLSDDRLQKDKPLLLSGGVEVLERRK
jgi:hypothetical protein